jgi:hypothetical protein
MLGGELDEPLHHRGDIAHFVHFFGLDGFLMS